MSKRKTVSTSSLYREHISYTMFEYPMFRDWNNIIYDAINILMASLASSIFDSESHIMLDSAHLLCHVSKYNLIIFVSLYKKCAISGDEYVLWNVWE